MFKDYFVEVFYHYQAALNIMIGLSMVLVLNPLMPAKSKNYLYKIIALDAILMIAESMSAFVLKPNIEMFTFRTILDVVCYMIRPVIIMYFYLLVCGHVNIRFRFHFVVPITINAVVLSFAFYNKLTFYYDTVDGQTTVIYGPLGFVPFVISMCYLLMLVIDSIRYFKGGGGKPVFATIYCALTTVVGSIVELKRPDCKCLVNVAAISALIYFLMINIRTAMRQRAEIVKQLKIEMMYSQIGHHFIFNTLSAIYGLIDRNPPKAKEAVDKFSSYLRGNIDAISKNGPIPFAEELKHIESYAWIEKMRFEDSLEIKYEIETIDFNIPVLSVQPLVENAIKHGVRKKNEPGTVIIRTYESEDEYVVEVEDDGVGFDVNAPIKNDDREHVGLSNIKQRFEDSGIGTFEIESEIGKGTIARIRIKIEDDIPVKKCTRGKKKPKMDK